MPVHDWTLVETGIFHTFHTSWLPEIQRRLNDGLLPDGYYALAEQHFGAAIADVLTLHEGVTTRRLPWRPGGRRWRRRRRARDANARSNPPHRCTELPRSSGHRLVALVEIVSPANKDRPQTVSDFAAKVVAALDTGVHVLIVDLVPPGRFDPHGLVEPIAQRLARDDEPYDLPAEEPLTLASYAAGPRIEAYVEHVAVGAALPDMPLFLRPDRYVNVPLEATYQSAYAGLPAFWRRVLETGKYDAKPGSS